MLSVLLCHARQDSAAAQALAVRLELCAEARVSLAATQVDAPDLLHLWDVEDADAVLLLLAPECVPPHSSRAAWQPVLDQLQSRARPDVGAVVLRQCAYPPLLERDAFFRSGLEPRHLRDLAAWLLNLHPAPVWPEWAVFQPARPAANPDPDSLAALWRIADEPGFAALEGASAPATALRFARESAAQFRATLWLDCLGRAPQCVAGELAAALAVASDGPLEEVWSRISAVLFAHRVLLVLDGWQGALPWDLNARGRSSLLMLAPAVLPEAAASSDPLWLAALACRPSGFPLALAARAAGLSLDEALREARLLCEQGLLAELDPFAFRYRRLASGAAPGDARLRHALALSEILLHRHRDPSLAARCAAELDAALPFAIDRDWPLAVNLVNRAVLLFEEQQRRLEAVHFLRAALQAAAVRGDEDNVARFRHKLSWLVDDSGLVHNRWQQGEQGSLFG